MRDVVVRRTAIADGGEGEYKPMEQILYDGLY